MEVLKNDFILLIYFVLAAIYLLYTKRYGTSVKSFAICLFTNIAYMLYGFYSQNDIIIFLGILSSSITAIFMYAMKDIKF